MDGINWLFLALLVVLMMVGVMTGWRGPGRSVDQNLKRCPNCETPMSLRRVSLLRSLSLLGAWVCPHCGNRTK
jgi:hypothetical protein